MIKKTRIISQFEKVNRFYTNRKLKKKLMEIYDEFSNYTMVRRSEFVMNLELCQRISNKQGAIVECGVWRGGMIAGIAKLLGKDRDYYLFDSFEGLPLAQEIDGKAAMDWQADTSSATYRDNCRAEVEFAQRAMRTSLNGEIERVHFIQGWFKNTLPNFDFNGSIAVLRLDGDWYESTRLCLEYLFPRVCENGIIIIDDYHTWDGCCKAVHDYLSSNKRTERISRYNNSTAYIVKK